MELREIVFRGKRIDNGEWVYGDVQHNYDHEPRCISDYCGSSPVDPFTVGQYTGLNDKNGKRIFEGDIIRWLPTFEEKTEVVSFDEAGFCAGEYFLQSALYYGDFDGKVIGNVHDNPELLGGSNG